LTAASPLHIIELSNHPEAERRRLRRRRLEEVAGTQARYEQALAEHQAHLDARQQERREARASRRWLTWLKFTLAVQRERQASPRQPPTTSPVSNREEVLSAGAEGEQIAASRFAARLNASWTMFRGYRNRGGEIDQLLLGPTGLWAVEVKYHNATVLCDDHQWVYRKYDNYGNLKEEDVITDKGGRSPSQQLNAAANVLERFLKSRGHTITIRRVVLFTHSRSYVAYRGDATVDLVTESADEVLDLMASTPGVLQQTQAGELEALIVRDHHHNNARRRSRHKSS
jgi:Nuclease-related domain